MFCPGCGEKNDDTTPCCMKCGLDLARLRVVIAESSQDISSKGCEDSCSGEGHLHITNTISDSVPEDPSHGESADLPDKTSGFDNSDPVQLKEHGNELFRQEKFLDALDCYEKALSIDQFYIEAWFNKSIVLKKIGRQDQSKVCWGIYKRLSSGEPEARKR